jgi:hypothetical protein
MATGWETIPVETLNDTEPGPAVRAGEAKIFNVIPIACGLPVIAMPPFTAAREIEPAYAPAARPADTIVTVKVALPPLATVAACDTANQPVPLAIVGVTVTLPLQAPITPTVKLCVPGFKPTSAEKVSPATDGACSVHTGCTVSETAITFGVPTANFVTLSMAVRVTVPVWVPAVNPVSTTPTLVAEGTFELTLPVAGVAVSHLPPTGVVEAVAVQVSAFTHAPLVVMAAACATGFGCPITPWKTSAGGVAATAQGACTLKVTGIDSGLPATVWAALSVPVMVIVAV